MLDLAIDPKLAWALRHRERFPVDVNTRRARGRCCGCRASACARSTALLQARRPRHAAPRRPRPARDLGEEDRAPFIVTARLAPGPPHSTAPTWRRACARRRSSSACSRMRAVRARPRRADFDGWREAARRLAAADVPPEASSGRSAASRLAVRSSRAPATAGRPGAPGPAPPSSNWPRSVVCHSDPARFDLLYRLLWRLRGRARPARDRRRPDGRAARLMAQVGAPRPAQDEGLRPLPRGPRPRTAASVYARLARARRTTSSSARRPFFVGRFTGMRWSILTPTPRLHWDGDTLAHGPGASRSRRAGRRSARGALADLLRQHLQPGPPQAARHARRDAQEVLAQPAREPADRPTLIARRRRAQRGHGHGRPDAGTPALPAPPAPASRRRWPSARPRALQHGLAACPAAACAGRRRRRCRARGPAVHP